VCVYICQVLQAKNSKTRRWGKEVGNHYFKVLHGFSLSFVFLKGMGNPKQIKAADILYCDMWRELRKYSKYKEISKIYNRKT
jgi:hypothetical protein